MKLDAKKIKNDLVGNTSVGLIVVRQTTSTQVMAKNYLKAHPALKKNYAFLADKQTAGYGRQHRNFYSPAQTGLYLTALLPRMSVGEIREAGLFTTGLAVSVARILERFYSGKHFSVKWVNDVLLGSKKVCGILTETEVQSNSDHCAFIVGIGINLSTVKFPQNLDRPVGSIDQARTINRNQLAGDIIISVIKLSKNYENGDFLKEYQQRLMLMHHRVTLNLQKGKIQGTVEGIDKQGHLLLKTMNNQIKAFSNGEVVKVKY